MPESPQQVVVRHRARAQFVKALYRYIEAVGPSQAEIVLLSWAAAVRTLWSSEMPMETEA